MMIYRLVILIMIAMLVSSQSNSVTVALNSYNINAVTNYTWTIFFNGTTNRSSITLNFPTQVTVTNASRAYLGGMTLLTISGNTSNSLTLNTNSNSIVGTVSIVVTNVINPPSAISTALFSVITNMDSSFAILTFSTVVYTGGSSLVCPWAFSLCTQQSSSNLTIQITTINPLILGTNQFIVGYLSPWANNIYKSLTSGISSVNCEVSFDGGTTYNTSVSCNINSANSRIIGTYTLTSQINSGSNVVIKIIGVQSPPTIQTSFSSKFTINTADGSGNIIDSYTNCVIGNVCVTNLTNGIINSSALPINQFHNTPQLYFNAFPRITVMGSDVIQVYYSPISDLSGCSTLRFWRLDTDITSMTSPILTTHYTFTISSSMEANQNYDYPINLYLICSSFKMPASQTPNYLTFKFLRSGSQYLELNSTVSAVAKLFTNSQAGLALSTSEMAKTSTYTFTFKSSQSLSATPMLLLDFPSDIGVTTSFTVSLSAGSINSWTFSFNSSTNVLSISLVAAALIPAGTTFTITMTGVTNPLEPIQYFIGLTTYYDSTITSRVQYNPNGFNATFSAVNQPTVTLTPSSLFVYTTTTVFISLKVPIALPANSQFSILFPAGVTSVSAASTLLQANGGPVILSSGPTNTTNGLVFTTNAISINSSLIMTISLRTPSVMATYSFVQLVISNGGVNYLKSLLTMSLNVNQLGSMDLKIIPSNPTAGATSSYAVTLTLSIPHPSQFTVAINLPSDAQLAVTGSSCSGNCLSTITNQNNNSFSFVATNSNPNSTSVTDVTFNISSFSNPRSTGQGLQWNVTTQTIGIPSNMISSQSASPTISLPNVISAKLSLNQVYYRNNSNPVKMVLTFTNKLISGDYILLTMDTTTYSNKNVTCSSLFGLCTLYPNSTAGILTITIVPNLTSIINNTLALTLEGLVSGLDTSYLDTNIIAVKSFTVSGAIIDRGSMNYNISCRDPLTLPNWCRQCNTLTYACINCYSGWFLNNSMCVTSCGDASNYLSFANSTTGTCQTCINNCSKCSSATTCITCVSSSYYFYPQTSTCNLICYNNSGYFGYTQSGQNICKTCYGYPLCVQCTSPNMGACTYCTNSSVLNAGICSGSCPGVGFFPSGGSCIACDTSCSTCNGSSNINCITCASRYYSYAGACLKTCPDGTAVAPSATTCGCDPKCLTCQSSNYYSCTICYNNSLFALSGTCVSSCPNATYISKGTACVACSTGCANCTSNTCLSCNTGWYLYNNLCYTDCKQVGLQFDKSGSSCLLCPSGCSTCNNAVCTSCLTSYSLSGSQCIETCLIYKTCSQTSAQVLPLPGLISLVLWTAIVLVIHLISHKNYIPYSLMLFSSVVQFILILAVLSTANSTIVYGRLLQGNTSYLSTMKLLLGLALGFNYITNIVFIVIFIKYMKPLLHNPRQIDIISNIVVLVVGTITNYRFALIAYAHMFPKPNIYISNPSKLTPIHYLCLASLITDVFPIIACGLGVINQQQKSNLFMLSIDLLIAIALNIAITIWFVSASKPDQYFQEKKKYFTEDQHNQTIDSIPNEKNASKGNIIGNGSLNFDDDFSQSNNGNNQLNDHEKYKKFIANQFKMDQTIEPNNILPATATKQETKVIAIKKKASQSVDYSMDADYEPNLKSKHSGRHSQRLNAVNTVSSDEYSIDDNLSLKGKSSPANFSKQALERYSKDNSINKEIKEVEEENDFQDFQIDEKKDGRASVFDQKVKRLRPKRVGAEKSTMNNSKQKDSGKSADQPIKMIKKDHRVGYLESDAFESNPEPEDLQAIIKQKVWQSTVRLPNQKTLSHESNQETSYEEISPSFYNIQNQRLDISEYDEAQSQL